jgi:carboxyl-terminal processing protease
MKFLPKLLLSLSLLSVVNATEIEKIETIETETTPTRIESITKLSSIIQLVERFYVDEVEFNEIVNKSIKGLLEELDSHSTFMDEKYYKEMKIQTKGEFGGLGIVVSLRKGALTVISPIDDTPAKKAGVEAGDIILKIDDKTTLDMTLDDAVKLMRGKPKTETILTLVRKGETKPLKTPIIRDIIKIESVHAKVFNDILYLRVSSFDAKVASELSKHIKEYDTKTKGIILDLRNNPGGLLSQAIDTTNLFIDEGVIVSQKGRQEDDNEIHFATIDSTITKKPIVVLVNEGSASASEIVSGALQDHKRGIVVGSKTFGKGSVQVVIPISTDVKEGIKLTIAKYYLPSGRTIQAKGITPDVMSFKGESIVEDKDAFKIKESDLKKHLEGELEKIDIEIKDEDKLIIEKEIQVNNKNTTSLTQTDLDKDNQLQTGINILKSMIIIQK